MSNLARGDREDYPEAAAKHLDDAEILLANGRHDNSAYLAGYVVECALKTLIRIEQVQTWDHDLDRLSRRAEELAALPGARSARYSPVRTPGHAIYDYLGGGWHEALRYCASGTFGQEEARSWLEEAEKVFAHVIVPLRLDGVIC